MKKFVFILILIVFSNTSVFATQKKQAIKSDIQAFIDYTPIESYNVDGHTYIIAEELSYYGFDVEWDENSRVLIICRRRLTTPLYTKNIWNEHYNTVIGTYYDIFDTDIITYLDGDIANSYNIGGQTIVQIDELVRCGEIKWDNRTRTLNVYIFQKELEEDFINANNKVIIPSQSKTVNLSTFDGWIEGYEGQVDENTNLPHGIGALITSSAVAMAGPVYEQRTLYLGYFKDGKPFGKTFKRQEQMVLKTGYRNNLYFIGEVGCGEIDYEEQMNFGVMKLPYHSIYRYDGAAFPDKNRYIEGMYYEHNTLRGGEDVSFFRTWYDGIEIQATLISSKRFSETQFSTSFTEYQNGQQTFTDERK